jgi:hypothetical protein
MSRARNSIPARSVPKNVTVLSVAETGRTRRSRSSGIAKARPSGTVMSRPDHVVGQRSGEPAARRPPRVADVRPDRPGQLGWRHPGRVAKRDPVRHLVELAARPGELNHEPPPAVPERHRDVRHDLPHAPARAQRGLVPAAGRQGVKHGGELAALGGDHVLDGVHRVSRESKGLRRRDERAGLR